MKREQRQSPDADFSAFVLSEGRQLVRPAELLTGDPHRAADLVQSALERAYPHWHRITADDPTTYVRRIVINQHRDLVAAGEQPRTAHRAVAGARSTPGTTLPRGPEGPRGSVVRCCGAAGLRQALRR